MCTCDECGILGHASCYQLRSVAIWLNANHHTPLVVYPATPLNKVLHIHESLPALTYRHSGSTPFGGFETAVEGRYEEMNCMFDSPPQVRFACCATKIFTGHLTFIANITRLSANCGGGFQI